jgi:hypothetical protein
MKNSKNEKTQNLSEILNQATDSYNCNLKEKNMFLCFQTLDKKIFFKKRQYQKCVAMEKEFQHCLIYANENSLFKRNEYKTEFIRIDSQNKHQQIKLENKIDAFNYVEGNKSEADMIDKTNSGSGARKKIVEL